MSKEIKIVDNTTRLASNSPLLQHFRVNVCNSVFYCKLSFSSPVQAGHVPLLSRQALAQFVTHHAGVHSRLCLDEAEVADHVVGLMQNLAAVPFKRKISALSVSQNGEHVTKNDPNRVFIKKSTWLRALVALPKLSGGFAVAIADKYPSMRALLNVYLDPSITVRDKEFLLQDLVKEAPIGSARSRVRVGPACSKRVYRIFMAQRGNLLTDEVEEGADMFDD